MDVFIYPTFPEKAGKAGKRKQRNFLYVVHWRMEQSFPMYKTSRQALIPMVLTIKFTHLGRKKRDRILSNQYGRQCFFFAALTLCILIFDIRELDPI